MADAELIALEMPMKHAFGHARAARRTAQNLLFVLDWNGVEGVGESVPREYVTGEALSGAFDAITAFDVGALDVVFRAPDLRDAVTRLEALNLPARLAQANGKPGLAAACAIELAAVDILGKKFRRPLRAIAAAPREPRRYKGTKVFDLTKSPRDFVAALTGVPGHIKIKSGAGSAEDVARIRAVRSAFPDTTLSIDANMAWSVDEAIRVIEEQRPLGIAWYEEPIAQGDYAGCAEIRKKTGARIMLDESLCSYADGEAAIVNDACDLFNVRVSKCGGFLPSLRLMELAHRNEKRVQVGAQVGQMGVLCAASRHLVGAVDRVVSYEGADARAFFTETITNEPVITDDDYACGDLPGDGLGVALNRDVVARHATLTARWSSGAGWS